jgi:hypothetical protein
MKCPTFAQNHIRNFITGGDNGAELRLHCPFYELKRYNLIYSYLFYNSKPGLVFIVENDLKGKISFCSCNHHTGTFSMHGYTSIVLGDGLLFGTELTSPSQYIDCIFFFEPFNPLQNDSSDETK